MFSLLVKTVKAPDRLRLPASDWFPIGVCWYKHALHHLLSVTPFLLLQMRMYCVWSLLLFIVFSEMTTARCERCLPALWTLSLQHRMCVSISMSGWGGEGKRTQGAGPLRFSVPSLSSALQHLWLLLLLLSLSPPTVLSNQSAVRCRCSTHSQVWKSPNRSTHSL